MRFNPNCRENQSPPLPRRRTHGVPWRPRGQLSSSQVPGWAARGLPGYFALRRAPDPEEREPRKASSLR